MKTEPKAVQEVRQEQFNLNTSSTVITTRVPYSLKVDLMYEAMNLKQSLSEYLFILLTERKEGVKFEEKARRLEIDLEVIQKDFKAFKAQSNSDIGKYVKELEKLSNALKTSKEEKVKINEEMDKSIKAIREKDVKLFELAESIKKLNQELSLTIKKAEESKKEEQRLLKLIREANQVLESESFKVGGGFLESGRPYRIKV